MVTETKLPSSFVTHFFIHTYCIPQIQTLFAHTRLTLFFTSETPATLLISASETARPSVVSRFQRAASRRRRFVRTTDANATGERIENAVKVVERLLLQVNTICKLTRRLPVSPPFPQPLWIDSRSSWHLRDTTRSVDRDDTPLYVESH